MCSLLTHRVSRSNGSNEQRNIRRWPFGESVTDYKISNKNSTSKNSNSLPTYSDDTNKLAKSYMLLLYPLSTRKDQLDQLVYPRRLILGLWRVYEKLVIKMTRLEITKCKKSSHSSGSEIQVQRSRCRKSDFPNCNYNNNNNNNNNNSNDNSISTTTSLTSSSNRNGCSENRWLSSTTNTNSNNKNNDTAINTFSSSSDPVNNFYYSCQKSKITSDSVNNCNWDSFSQLSSSSLKSSSVVSSSTKSSSSSQRRSCHSFVKFSMGSWTFLVLFYLLLLLGSTVACGPGRGAGRRRAPRKLTPLVYKQHVPNVPENTLSASGLNEGRITRNHQRFKNLVPNYNQDIIFRDDEGSGADRLMTQRCKEKLNTLAISVMNQWPGVKLRVIEGWDEENLHATHSLHYEGRAVDITTSDKDRSKYGMLARLAVEAGFDWVYYESRAHIHCSVKSDSTQAGRTGGCFSGNSTVETPNGQRKISEITSEDQILSIDSSGKEVFSDVLLFLDRNTSETREFFVLKTASGTEITLTPSHLVYTVQPESLTPDEQFLFSPNSYILYNQTIEQFLDKSVISFAKNVQLGDWILVKSDNNNSQSTDFNKLETDNEDKIYSIEKVIDMEARVETGVYAPLTSTGNLIVDGVLASCYAVIDDQSLAHSAFLPVRLTHNLVKGAKYIWKQFSRFISFSHFDTTPTKSLQVISPHRFESNEVNPSVLKDNRSFRTVQSGTGIEQGVHWYASSLYTMSKYILPSHLQYDN